MCRGGALVNACILCDREKIRQLNKPVIPFACIVYNRDSVVKHTGFVFLQLNTKGNANRIFIGLIDQHCAIVNSGSDVGRYILCVWSLMQPWKSMSLSRRISPPP